MTISDVARADPARAYVSIYPVDPMPPAIAALREGREPVWIFAYGSLMWHPDFDFAEARPAFLYGYHRRLLPLFARLSRHARAARTGARTRSRRLLPWHRLLSAAGPGGPSLDRIWAREMTGRVYEMRRVALRTAAGQVTGHACVVRRESPDYAGRLSVEEAARRLAVAVGGRGTGRDYLANTVRHLEELGIHDALLHRIAARVASSRRAHQHAKNWICRQI